MVNVSFDTDSSGGKLGNNVSISDDYLLWLANERLYHINTPTVVFYIIAIVVGIFGNTLVIYVFRFRFKKSTANIFVVCLSAFDTITCFMLIFEVFDKRLPMYSGQYPAICKLVRCLEVFANGGASVILVGIAFDRYYKICKPFRRLTMRTVRNLIIGTVILMLLASWPMMLFHGSETVTTIYPDISGKDCADDDQFKGSIYPGIYFIILFVFIIACIAMIVVLYSLIFVAILKWKHRIVGEDIRSASISESMRHSSFSSQKQKRKSIVENSKYNVTNCVAKENVKQLQSPSENDDKESKFKEIVTKNKDKNDLAKHTTGFVNEAFTDLDEETEDVFSGMTKTVSCLTVNSYTENNMSKTTISNELVIEKPIKDAVTKPKERFFIDGSMSIEESKIKLKYKVKLSNLRRRFRRHGSKADVRISATTVVFSFIALLYVLSYIPTIVVESINAIDPLIEEQLSDATRKVVVMANSAYFMNGAFNPLLYGMFNKAFRDELLLIVKGRPK